MLSDYIPVYWPGTNTWSIPHYELKKYKDYVAKPQAIVLFEGHVVKGVPLLHFGTWGAFGADITGTIQAIAQDPDGACEKLYRSKKVAADTAEFFRKLAKRYPGLVSVRRFAGGRTRGSMKLNVPARCVVKVARRGGR